MHVANHIATGIEPLDACRKAVEQAPRDAEARLKLAHALAAADDPAEAVEQCGKALELQADLRAAAWLLAYLLQQYALNEEIDLSPRGLRAAFQFIDVDRQALCNGAIAYLTFHAPLAEVLARGESEGWDAAAKGLLKGSGRKLLQDRLFRIALTHGVNMDLRVEFLLTAFRKQLLLSPGALKARPVYEFACVLIQHCDNNGYVFCVSDAERKLLARLTVDPAGLFEGDRAAVGDFFLAALYSPISALVDTSVAGKGFNRIAPRALRAIVTSSLETKQREAEFIATLPRLTAVTDETSQRVAKQYETAPYPRWLSLQAPEPGSAIRRLHPYFSELQTARLSGPSDVLIAGAGTGQQAVHAAIAYGSQARILAIDISAPSLAYGLRMAEIFGVENIQFATADILRLGEIDSLFDVIECGGVLHHMAAPYEAWRRLVEKLHPGGLMQIGLYSAVSRRAIEGLAADRAWPGATASDDALRDYRHSIMGRREGEAGFELTRSIDFFSTGDFRDLALHVQEQRCTLPEIRDFLTANGLQFHGFTLPPTVHQSYQEMFPDDTAPGTLDHWWEFEQRNPRTFDGMYVFWCRRPGIDQPLPS